MSSNPYPSPELNAPDGNEAKLEERLRRAAATFPYPLTPDLAAKERQRLAGQERTLTPRRPARWALGLALLLIAVMSVLLVSPVRARVLDWIRIGAVRIFLVPPTPTPTAPAPTGTPFPAVKITPIPTVLSSVLGLSGETSLTEAQEQAGFTIQRPAYPPDLGEPGHVYFQSLGGPVVVVLVWMDPDRPGQVRMVLSETSSSRLIFQKYAPESVLETQVNGNEAVWVEGDYLLVMGNGDVTMTRLIEQGHTLIWKEGEITFRLETDDDLETAIRIAESISE